MAGFSFYSQIYHNLRMLWRRRKYQRLDNSGRRNLKIVRLGGNNRRVRKIGAIPKLKLCSPIKLLARLREAYIDAMIGFATSAPSLHGGYGFGGKRVTNGRQGRWIYNEYYEKKVMLEIHRSLSTREPYA